MRTGARSYELDALVFATGYDAMTGALLAIDVHGRGGARCATSGRTARGPTSGSAIAGFPNLFTIIGPGSPSVLSNVIVSIEQHVDWIADCARVHARARARPSIEATEAAEDAWVEQVNEAANCDPAA